MSSVSDSINLCFAKSKKKKLDLAARWHTSRQAVSNKFYRDYWSADELVDLARFFGADLIFRFQDGMEVPVTTDAPPRLSFSQGEPKLNTKA